MIRSQGPSSSTTRSGRGSDVVHRAAAVLSPPLLDSATGGNRGAVLRQGSAVFGPKPTMSYRRGSLQPTSYSISSNPIRTLRCCYTST